MSYVGVHSMVAFLSMSIRCLMLLSLYVEVVLNPVFSALHSFETNLLMKRAGCFTLIVSSMWCTKGWSVHSLLVCHLLDHIHLYDRDG